MRDPAHDEASRPSANSVENAETENFWALPEDSRVARKFDNAERSVNANESYPRENLRSCARAMHQCVKITECRDANTRARASDEQLFATNGMRAIQLLPSPKLAEFIWAVG